MKRYILFIILISLAVFFQINFIGFLPNYFRYINPLLIIIIFIMITRGLKESLISALIIGLVLDLYSFLNFGLYIISYTATTVIIYYIFQKFITNKTVYTYLILTFSSSLFFYLSLALFSNLINYFNLGEYSIRFSTQYLFFILLQTFFNALIILIIYFIINFLSNRLKANFIFKKINEK